MSSNKGRANESTDSRVKIGIINMLDSHAFVHIKWRPERQSPSNERNACKRQRRQHKTFAAAQENKHNMITSEWFWFTGEAETPITKETKTFLNENNKKNECGE